MEGVKEIGLRYLSEQDAEELQTIVTTMGSYGVGNKSILDAVLSRFKNWDLVEELRGLLA
ncbi:hypothetical protein ABGV42_00795 [Paenibacillus pabuli]|uniref:hypothetical protein n=1 Tax=Paenibacillus pabuli TaxID=1472 RepID=UPI003241DB1D